MKSIFTIGLSYVFIRYIVLGISFIKTIIIAYYLGPERLGIYAILILIVEYLNYTNLGVFDSMNRDVALHLDKSNKREEIKNLIANSLGFVAIVMTIMLIVFFSSSIFINLDAVFEKSIIQYLPIVFLLVLVYQLKQFIVRYLRLYERYMTLGFLELTTQSINLLGVFIFIESYQINAVLYSILISNIFLVSIGFIYTREITLRFNFSVIRNLITSGTPMLFYSIFLFLFLSIDRAMIAFFYTDVKALGYYQLALSLAAGMFTVFKAVTFLFQPKLLRYLNQNNNLENSKFASIKIQSLYMELVLVVLSVIGIVLVPIALDMFLPDYSISILLTQFLLMALVLYSVSFFVITFLISNQYELKTLLPLLYCIILSIILNYVLVVLGYGLYGIAYSKVIVFGIYSVIIFRLYLKIIEEKFFKNIFSIFIRLALFLAPLTIIVYEKMPLYYVFILFLFIYSHTLIKFIQIILLPFVNSYKEQP